VATQNWELEQYLTELTAYPERRLLSPEFLRQYAGYPALASAKAGSLDVQSRRACATLSAPTASINGFELLEHDPIPGREEYLDSEKYEIKVRDWDKPGNIKPYIRDLNRARRENPALQQTSQLRFVAIDDGNVIGFVKESSTKPTPSPSRLRCRARCTNSGFRLATSSSGRAAIAATSPRSRT
jgi:starch synthase (maltosyl-transferring)